MKAGLIIVLSLLAGALVAGLLMEDPGYVLINVRGYVIEMSVPILLAGIVLIYLALRALIQLWRTPRKLGRAAGQHRKARAEKQLARGLTLVAGGDWQRGERLLGRSARRSGTPLIGYLSAARAAQEQGQPQRRDAWLKLAAEEDDKPAPAVLLTTAELQMDSGEVAAARRTLDRLREIAPRHPRSLQLLSRALAELKDWQALKALIPDLLKTKALTEADLDRTVEQAYSGVLQQLAAERDYEGLLRLWRQLPKRQRDRAGLFHAYAEAVIACGRDGEAELMIRRRLKRAWQAGLVDLYARLKTDDPAKHLAHAEAWLHQRSEDPELLLAVARLSMRSELWGKARSYLESSLAIRPTPAGYALYGELLGKLGEEANATEAYRKGLALSSRSEALPALPAGEPRR
jgi:HemY protein